jgi:hypothetical protein
VPKIKGLPGIRIPDDATNIHPWRRPLRARGLLFDLIVDSFAVKLLVTVLLPQCGMGVALTAVTYVIDALGEQTSCWLHAHPRMSEAAGAMS